MRFSRQMIELIQQIRKPVMAELGEPVLLADPLLLQKLGQIAQRSGDPMVKAAIAEVLRQAGTAPPAPPRAAATPGGRKIYRGCVIG